MIISRYHPHTDAFGAPIGGVRIEIDTDEPTAETHARQRQKALWWQIREAAEDAFAVGERYRIASSGKVHDVSTIAELAAVTRRERALWGVTWREDPKAVV